MNRRPVPAPSDTYELVPLGSPAGIYNITALRAARESKTGWRSTATEPWRLSSSWQWMSSAGSTWGVGDGISQ
jgi:hypothetical protein